MCIIPFDIQVIYNAVTEGPDVDNSSLANIFDIEPNSGRDTSSIHAGSAGRVININAVSVTQYAHINTYVLSMYMCVRIIYIIVGLTVHLNLANMVSTIVHPLLSMPVPNQEGNFTTWMPNLPDIYVPVIWAKQVRTYTCTCSEGLYQRPCALYQRLSTVTEASVMRPIPYFMSLL